MAPGSPGALTEKDRSGQIGLFSTPEGIRTVDSPVRAAILAALRERDHSYEEIVRFIGKAKSTVSVHLRALLREGIIGERGDPADSRRKIFFIRSRHLGDLSAGIESGEIWKTAGTVPDDPFVFYRFMLRTIRVSLLSRGINIDPVLREAGYRIGAEVSNLVEADNLDQLLGRLGDLWQRYHLGKIEVVYRSPVTIRVYDCFECADLPALGRPACALDAGLLDAIFTRHFAHDQKATEIRCYAMGNQYCEFVIRPEEPGRASR